MCDKTVRVMPNGMKIPAIGLGTWRVTNETELEKALNVALECGYRHIDTAYMYENEEFIGRVLQKWFCSGKLKRQDIFVTTELPMCGIHENRVEMFIDRSLKNLKLDYIDLYLIPFPVGTNYVEGYTMTPFDQMQADKSDHIEIWKKMEEQVEAGKTKFIGLSNFNQNQIEKVWNNCRIKPACLQVEIHIFLQQPELVSYCHEKNIAVVAYSPLASPGYNAFLTELGMEKRVLPNIFTDPIVTEIASKHNKSNGQIVLRFLIENNIIPIPKSVTPSRIKENFEVFGFQLDEEDKEKLKKLDIGESARVCDFKAYPRINEHPEWPFPK